MDSIFGSFGDLVATRPIEHLGCQDLSFGGQLQPPLKVVEDGGASGCGGKIWTAGELLCEYILEKSPGNELLGASLPKGGHISKVLELGSGTGVVGLCVSLLAQQHHLSTDTHISITDIGGLVPLMQSNIDVNDVNGNTNATELLWGEPLFKEYRDIDLVLAADCVYLEEAFPLLERTLLDLTDQEDSQPIVLMAYRRRRKADRKFFQRIKHNFDVIEVSDFSRHSQYLKLRTHLFQLVRTHVHKQ
ncbi:similar to Saccharomyces cerevisiae YNL024C Putative protein of unknown function with seven beta-strand methyltransferase motif [Maudiozyma barnettii]|uniref:Elongation factor methyltransferase 6 n=1 Tax=Maudiozyma barnettii TaxID=61262 RepID=A0A8H2VCL6_9SACH|nr:uncharacterized protein KABA2_02S04642 [Kazachstania barnettii]CAB4252797.1 similar to Saccharomyces cerevisiae YNL024C Putative protein of unknown function with seven beta-strand methyltransferase motif [Kazachstania barnettii]CAD1780587.1 similar to Saccharomyces cerevisiae YNL024C Putative protein of unknown function with seven beta-strand methyltransferase motif [Kazachstania barnettii]